MAESGSRAPSVGKQNISWVASGFSEEKGINMSENKLVRRVGELGIFESFLGTFNVVNLRTKRIAAVLNFLTVEDAEEYIAGGVTYMGDRD